LTILLHYPALESGWLFDDLQILKHAVEYHPWEYFFVPQIWQELSVSNLTPWVTLSFDMDLSLFGSEPRFFYVHHLFSLWLSLVMLYTVLRMWVPRSYAFCGSLLFFVSAPIVLSAEFLCLRHYVEGSVLILLSLFLFIIALRRKNFHLSYLSAISYFFSMTAKEIYVPFVLVILFLPEGKWSSRVKYTTPHFIALLFYIVWRSWMLGRVIGGYQSELLNKNIFPEIYRIAVTNTSESIKMLAGVSSIGNFVHFILLALTIVLLMIAFLIYVRKRRFSEIIFISIVIISVYAPISPSFIFFSVNAFDSYRFLLLFSLVYASLTVVIAHRLSPSGAQPGVSFRIIQRGAILSIVAVTTALIFFSSYQWITAHRELTIKPLVAEDRFLMNADTKSVMVKTSALPLTTYYEIMDYFRMLYKKQHIPNVVYGIFFDIRDNPISNPQGLQVYKYSSTEKGMVEITKDFFAKRKDYLSRVRKMPFHIRLTVKDGKLDFVLGPSDTGHYFLLAGYRSGMYNWLVGSPGRSLPSKVFPGKIRRYVRFGWESPEGWVTFSPEWFIDFSKDQEIVWSQ
jgi:hypothetical protein